VILQAEAERVRKTLSAARQRLSPAFEWYPYDSLANAERLDRLLGASPLDVLGEPASSPILDIGCADGDLAFLLDSFGFPVTAIDHASTNHNGMRGIRALRQAVDSNIRILEADIDSQFTLPDGRFRLAVFFGILYHLKNPFHALERLAKSCDYCVLSTRVARRFPGGSPIPAEHPLAYLLAADELNRDNSNYWIFNEAGLRRLLTRAHWEVVEFFTIGDTQTSDPVSPQHDERAYCLLRSHYGLANVELLQGWHQLEDTGWRWVARRFSVRCDQHRTSVTVRGFLPPEVFTITGPVRLAIKANGTELRSERLAEAGDWTVTRKLPEQGSDGLILEFTVDKALPPTDFDDRELALIVASIDLQ
jgi:tRNA (mo5U34)-methyltransferase